ncbi:CRISPR system precrRNA processing endoribonuclease RAMP protein Cas6 [Desulfurispirillum indicum]|uniref:CRISPR system precrRNA processing endoribonuclease RAMP protein Cas6 n=1 Tax=Desulfurispirillum indicum TaxID=936456 RepID=UPI001CFAD1B0|nr:CRISPR system precrRNA processing endoribonuclease RAMP protein Cas6 [Desulfurispirillum indicum]UCZ57700.1 CRISPR system precrRNA processing endoribonuclease RAMP protein Cas6 [Desulfurispirillum indicum]
MQIVSFSTCLKAKQNSILPQYKFSTLRGALGHGLRRVICIKRRAQCQDCSLLQHCPYTTIFDNSATQTEFLPLVCYSGNEQTEFQAGDTLPVHITLMGHAAAHSAYTLLALQEMASQGLGKDRQPFTIGDPPPYLQQVELFGETLPAGTYRMHLQSPLRSKSGSRLTTDLDLPKILQLAVKRVQTLYDSQQQPAPHLTQVMPDAREISRNLRWLDIGRYSNRQATKMKLGGFVGSMEFSDPTGAAASLLAAVAKIHIGKQTTFGYGKIELEKEE